MSDDVATAPINLVDLIDQLVKPTAPLPIAMTPQTWGWYAVGLVLLGAVLFALWRWQRSHRANAYRRTAMHALHAAGQDPVAISEILRRTALAAFPRTEVAGLRGAEWLAFLDRTGAAKCRGDVFQSGAGRAVAEAPYRMDLTLGDGLQHAALEWVRYHRREDAS